MTMDGKPARVAAFSKEQGFGRVAISDEGELVFDAAAAACSLDELVVGADVIVRTGPARVPGQRKVIRLWRPGAPPVEAPSVATREIERYASLGPYRLLLPPFWPETSVTERGPVWTSGAKLNDVQCILMVVMGGAADAKMKSDLVASRSAGARTTRCDVQSLGLPFEGYRFDRGAESELLYLAAAHGDLLSVGCVLASDSSEAEKLAPLLLTMVAAAVHRRGPPSIAPSPAKPAEGGFWKRLFGG